MCKVKLRITSRFKEREVGFQQAERACHIQVQVKSRERATTASVRAHSKEDMGEGIGDPEAVCCFTSGCKMTAAGVRGPHKDYGAPGLDLGSAALLAGQPWANQPHRKHKDEAVQWMS